MVLKYEIMSRLRFGFYGEFERNVDHKGRMMLPREFKSYFSEGLIITRGLDDCLEIYTPEEWEKILEKVHQLPQSSEDSRTFVRFFFTNAYFLVPDAQGRIMIPAKLRKIISLKNQVIVAGVGNRIELWNPEAWGKFQTEKLKDYKNSAIQTGI